MVGVTGTGVTTPGDCRHPPRNTWTLIRQHLNGTCGGAFANNATGPAVVTQLPATLSSPGAWHSARRPHACSPSAAAAWSSSVLTAPASPPTSIRHCPISPPAGQGGLLDVALDPDYNGSNTRIYWTFSETGSGGSGTAVARGDLNAVTATISNARSFTGKRPRSVAMVTSARASRFRSDKTLMVTLGERQTDDPAAPTSNNAQHLGKTLGKVIPHQS